MDGAQATPSWGDHEPSTPAFPGGPIDTPVTDTPSQSKLMRKNEEETAQDTIDTSLSLDQFQMRYTSEDNASFNEIIEKINAQKKEKYKWLYDQEKKSIRLLENGSNNQEQRLLREAGENGGGSSSSQALVRVGDGDKQDGPSKFELALADNRSGVVSTWEYKVSISDTVVCSLLLLFVIVFAITTWLLIF
jgi:protein DGCR14